MSDQTVRDPADVDVDDGPIDRESPLYVERDIEPAFLRALQQEDRIVLLKGSQQVGRHRSSGARYGRQRTPGGRLWQRTSAPHATAMWTPSTRSTTC